MGSNVGGVDHDIGTTVDPSKSMLIFAGSFFNDATAFADTLYQGMVAMSLTGSGTLRAERTAPGATDSAYFGYNIIEFNSGIASVQRNIYNVSARPPSYTDITINSVNTSMSIASITQSAYNVYPIYHGYLELVNSTTLRMHHNTNQNSNLHFGWEVVEFE
jgi:hypothetical protein